MSDPFLRIPPGPRAALSALHLRAPRFDELARLTDSQWRAALEFCNRSQITLTLRQRAGDVMPAWIREIVDGNLERNIERLCAVEELYRSIAGCLGTAGIEFLALKGLTQCPLFGSAPEERPQYDIDLYSPQAGAARDALLGLGFESMEGMDKFPTDHLPALIRNTGWQYRGDVFDPEMPLAIEMHFRFWNGDLERLRAPGVEEFWARRVVREPLGMPALAVPDALAYACLHLLKHLLRSNLRPFHVYEVACFLDSHAADEAFWTEWRRLHPPALRRLQAVAFRLAEAWFGCAPGPAADVVLPAATVAWFDRFAWSPAAAPFDANKDELWLHWSLLDSKPDALAVARRRLVPSRLPAAAAVRAPGRGWIGYVAGRLLRHARALPALARSGVRWWWSKRFYPRKSQDAVSTIAANKAASPKMRRRFTAASR